MDQGIPMELPNNSATNSSFKPTRTAYPGSKFGPKTRYDLPLRHKSYGNSDEADAILFAGSALQPHAAWHDSSHRTQTLNNIRSDRTGGAVIAARAALGTPRSASTGATPRALATPRGAATPRGDRVLGDSARSMFHPLAVRNLPELPLIDEKNDVHGSLVLGGKSSGRTSLIHSLMAVMTGKYPTRHDEEIQEKKASMPAYGQCYEMPERDVRLGGGTVKNMRLVLTDTPPCGTIQREEQPLCAHVSPNSQQHYNAIPSWMRITLRGGNFPHYACLFVIDSTAKPLWEDGPRCRDLARLLAVLKRNQYTVILAVTKLHVTRARAVRDTNHGHEHGKQVGRDPRSSYEAFVGRYLEKVCSSIQGKADENDWCLSQGPDSPPFPLQNATIFDAPTWVNVGDYRKWQERKGTIELPNFKYMSSQLERILAALCVRSHPE